MYKNNINKNINNKKENIEKNNKYKLYFWHFLSSLIFIILVIILSFGTHNKILNLNINLLTLVILTLAVFRLIHLIVYDTVMDFFRDFVDKYSKTSSFFQSFKQLINCPWCTGMWISLFITFLYIYVPLSIIFLLILGIAGVASSLEEIIIKIKK
ncbi:MAG: DUF1360 domain-containing protein [Nanoarchaeota archaeon]